MLTIRHFKPICIGLLAFFLISSVLAGFFSKKKTAPAQTAAMLHDGHRLLVPALSPLRKLIVIQTTTNTTVAVPFTVPAIVEADPATLVNVLPPLLGRIASLNKRLGDAVKQGDILFSIDSPDLTQALSDLEKSEAALLFAKQKIDRQIKLNTYQIGAKLDKEQAQNDYTQALSDFQRAKIRLKILNVEPSLTDKEILIVRSPVSGFVTALNAAVGGFWNDATSPIMTVADLSKVFVTAKAQEKNLGELYLGQSVNITFDAYPQTLSSKVAYISPILDADTRTISARMVIDNLNGQLKPNMFAKAVFTRSPHSGIVLPLSAVIQRGFDSIVFVEVSPWQFEARIVKPGPQVDDSVELLSGLQVNERVVVQGSIILND